MLFIIKSISALVNALIIFVQSVFTRTGDDAVFEGKHEVNVGRVVQSGNKWF